MKRIAILGCENSHASAFLRFIAQKEEFRDVEVVGVYSDEPAAAEKLKEKYGVPVLASYADAVGKIDGLIITARHGDNHYKFAKPYLDSGIPMFIDKPITISEAEAVEFMKALKERSVPVSGGSSLKQDDLIRKLKQDADSEQEGKTLGGYVRAPYYSQSPHGGFFFYAQHLVEMVSEIFGRYPYAVDARQSGGQIHVLFRYGEYDCVGLFCNESNVYYACRMSETGAAGGPVPISDDWFYREFNEFYGLLSGKGAGVDYNEFIAPVFVMNAILRSLEKGGEEPVKYPAV